MGSEMCIRDRSQSRYESCGFDSSNNDPLSIHQDFVTGTGEDTPIVIDPPFVGDQSSLLGAFIGHPKEREPTGGLQDIMPSSCVDLTTPSRDENNGELCVPLTIPTRLDTIDNEMMKLFQDDDEGSQKAHTNVASNLFSYENEGFDPITKPSKRLDPKRLIDHPYIDRL